MNPAFQRYLDAASGFTTLTAKKAEQLARSMVKSGAAASDQLGDLAQDLMERQRKNREQAARFIKRESQRAVAAMGLAPQREVNRLTKKVDTLQRRVADLEQQLTPASRSAAKKATAKRATAKKATAKKATAKKATAKKATAKKTTAKQSDAGNSAS